MCLAFFSLVYVVKVVLFVVLSRKCVSVLYSVHLTVISTVVSKHVFITFSVDFLAIVSSE